MLRPFCEINIQQVTPYIYNDDSGKVQTISRNRLITLNSVNEYEIESGWESHTNNCTIKLPKNVKISNGTSLFPESTTYNAILGGTTTQIPNGTITYAPLIMKGDIIYISDGYWCRNQNQKDIQFGSDVFSGYVSSVSSDVPIEIKCEDNFYLLKRVPFDSNKWTGNLYSLCNHILDLVNKKFANNISYNKITGIDPITGLFTTSNPYPALTFFEVPNSINADFSIGYLDIGDITCGQLLEKLKQQFHFESTFVGNVLRFGVTIYDETTANSSNFFAFRDIYNSSYQLKTSGNIFPSHDLEYTNKDDVVLSTIVQCKAIKDTGKTTKDGLSATKKTRLKLLVYWDLPTSSFKYVDLSIPGTVTPANPDGGERHSCWYPVDLTKPAPTIQQLFDLGVQQLNKYFYNGFKGCFTTFGFPYVDWNDNVNIIDSILIDRSGQYKVKKVKRKFGQHGISQEIHLDYLQQDVVLGKTIVRQIPQNTKSIYMI